jgi:hypothetical protein
MTYRHKLLSGTIKLFIVIFIFSSCSYKKKLTAINISLPSYYQSNMVFQEGQSIHIKGKCSPGGILAVRIETALMQIQADNYGNWEVVFPPINYKGVFKICIEGKDEIIQLDNVVTGSVWLIIGDGWLDLEKENIIRDLHSKISEKDVRYYQPSLTIYGTENQQETEWKVLSPGKVKSYEQFARMFGEELYLESNRPIGIINCAWPGTDFIHFAGDVPDRFTLPVGTPPDSLWNLYYLQKDTQYAIEDSSFNGLERGVLDERLDDYDWGEIDFPLQAGRKWFLKDRVIWFRKRFFVADKYRTGNFHIQMGTIRGNFIFYINGKKISEFEGESRNYSLEIHDTLLRRWSNLLTVRMVTSDSLSGFYSDNLKVVNDDSTYKMGITEDWKYRTYFEPELDVAHKPEYIFPRVKDELFSDIAIRNFEGIVFAGSFKMYANSGADEIEAGLGQLSSFFKPQKKIIFLLSKQSYIDSLNYNNQFISKAGELLQAVAASGYSQIDISNVNQEELINNSYSQAINKLMKEISK